MSADSSPSALTSEAARTRKSKSTAVLVFGGILLALLAGASAAWFILQQNRPTESATAVQSSAPRYLLHLEGFTVNLADPEETHFLRVTMDLGVDHLAPGSSEEKSTAAIPVGRVRDAILSVLTVGKADVLLTAEGKVQLKRNLVDALQKQVPEIGVREIYFTEFLVQR